MRIYLVDLFHVARSFYCSRGTNQFLLQHNYLPFNQSPQKSLNNVTHINGKHFLPTYLRQRWWFANTVILLSFIASHTLRMLERCRYLGARTNPRKRCCRVMEHSSRRKWHFYVYHCQKMMIILPKKISEKLAYKKKKILQLNPTHISINHQFCIVLENKLAFFVFEKKTKNYESFSKMSPILCQSRCTSFGAEPSRACASNPALIKARTFQTMKLPSPGRGQIPCSQYPRTKSKGALPFTFL